jgi:hypothetical protein
MGEPAERGRRSVDAMLRQVLDQGYQSRHVYPHGQIFPNFGFLAEMQSVVSALGDWVIPL